MAGPLTQGIVSEPFEGLRAQLEQNLADGADLGASVAVVHHGELVVDLWGGHLDPERTRPWERDTIVNVWSTTKTMTFLVTLMLADRGELSLDDPVARFWPEFAQMGKDSVSIHQVLRHTAGLPGFDETIRAEDLADWERCTSALARQEPWWAPGTQRGYHALTQGYLLGEVVRRITGRTFGRFLAEEVAGPIGADFHVGLDEADEPRVGPLVPLGPGEMLGPDPGPIARRVVASTPFDSSWPNHRWFRAAEVPAANGHGNARSVALIQSALAHGGEIAGRRLLRPETVETAFDGDDEMPDLVLGLPLRIGAGYGLASSAVPVGPRSGFWGGTGGSFVLIDADHELCVAYVMNHLRVGIIGDTRGIVLAFAAALAAAT